MQCIHRKLVSALLLTILSYTVLHSVSLNLSTWTFFIECVKAVPPVCFFFVVVDIDIVSGAAQRLFCNTSPLSY